MDDSLLLLDHLLELFFAEMAQELFVEHWHHTTFLLLGDQLLEKYSVLVVFRHV